MNSFIESVFVNIVIKQTAKTYESRFSKTHKICICCLRTCAASTLTRKRNPRKCSKLITLQTENSQFTSHRGSSDLPFKCTFPYWRRAHTYTHTGTHTHSPVSGRSGRKLTSQTFPPHSNTLLVFVHRPSSLSERARARPSCISFKVPFHQHSLISNRLSVINKTQKRANPYCAIARCAFQYSTQTSPWAHTNTQTQKTLKKSTFHSHSAIASTTATKTTVICIQ